MMTRRIFALGVLFTLAGVAGAAPVTVKNLSTGIVDATGQKIANNVSDTDYVFASGGTGGLAGTVPVARQTPLAAGWLADGGSSASRWIAVNSGTGAEGMSVATGTFLFQTVVDLTGYDPTTAFLNSVRYAADNRLTAVRVNGVTVFSQAPTPGEEFGSFISLPATLGLGQFVAGGNTITFEVTNTPPPPHLSSTPMGLRLEGSLSAAVPEPAACVSLATGLLLVVRRRAR
jgi:hypothetical protein